jgi:hypothetical protein
MVYSGPFRLDKQLDSTWSHQRINPSCGICKNDTKGISSSHNFFQTTDPMKPLFEYAIYTFLSVKPKKWARPKSPKVSKIIKFIKGKTDKNYENSLDFLPWGNNCPVLVQHSCCRVKKPQEPSGYYLVSANLNHQWTRQKHFLQLIEVPIDSTACFRL